MTTGCFVIKHPVLHFPGVSGRVIVKKKCFWNQPIGNWRLEVNPPLPCISRCFQEGSSQLAWAPSFCKFYFPNPFTFDYNMPQEGDWEKHLLTLRHQPCGQGRKDWACLSIYRCHSYRPMFSLGQTITAGCRQKEQVAHLGKATLSAHQL